jgi:CRP-like cAMP-binding protein
MAFIDQPTQIPEPYDLFFLRGQLLPSELILSRRKMANQTLGFSATVFRKKFRSAMSVRSYADNEIIFSQGDKADTIFYIQSGTVKLTMAATRRKKAIIAVLLRGSFLAKAVWEGKLSGCTRRDRSGPPISLACRRRARFARSSATRSLQPC